MRIPLDRYNSNRVEDKLDYIEWYYTSWCMVSDLMYFPPGSGSNQYRPDVSCVPLRIQ